MCKTCVYYDNGVHVEILQKQAFLWDKSICVVDKSVIVIIFHIYELLVPDNTTKARKKISCM